MMLAVLLFFVIASIFDIDSWSDWELWVPLALILGYAAGVIETRLRSGKWGWRPVPRSD